MGKLRKTLVSILTAFLLVVQLIPMQALSAINAYAADVNTGAVRVIVENNTFLEPVDGEEPPWTGQIVNVMVDRNGESNAMEIFKKGLDKAGIAYEESGGYFSSINGLGEFDGGAMSGWMVTINDWFTNTGINDQEVEDNDEIRFMYTCAYGEDLGGSWSNNDKTIKAMDFSVGKLSPSFSSDVNEYTLTVPAGTKGVVVTPTATNKNFQVRAKVDGTYYKRIQTIPIKDGTVIDVTCGDPTWPSMNNQAGGTGSDTPGVSYKITIKEEKAKMPVKVIVENTTFTEAEDEESAPPAWSGTLFDGTVEIDEGETVLTAIKTALDSKKIPYTTTSSGYLTTINGLDQNDATMGGWMGTVNDWFTSDNFVDCKLEANDEVRVMYTNAWGEDIGGSWSSKDKTLKALTTSVGKLMPSFSSAVKDYTLVLPEGTESVVVTPTATNKYFQVRASVDSTEYKRSAAIPVKEGTVIKVKCGDPAWPSMLNGTYGNGAENVPAETYNVTVTYKAPVEKYKLDLSVEPANGGTVDLTTTTYDADYNSTENVEKGLTSKAIDISAFGDNNAELKLEAVAAKGYKFVGWKVGDKVYTTEDGEIAALTGFTSLVDANCLYLFNYTDTGVLQPSKNLAVAAVFEEDKADQETLDKFVSSKLSYYKLRPQFGTDTNAVTMFNSAIAAMEGGENITATLKATDDPAHVSEEGLISYYDNFDFTGFSSIYQANVGLTYTLTLGNATKDVEVTALIGWDRDKVITNMNKEIEDNLTEAKMKGENTALNSVETDLVLPQILGSTYKQSLSQITWKSSNTDVIAIQNGEGYTYPDYIGKVTQPQEDTEVTLTATFKFTKTNTAIEKPITFDKEYKVLVKAKKIDIEAVKAQMLEELNSKYTADKLKDFTTKEVLDVNNVTGDVQLPRPSTIGLVNKEIAVTSSDESLLKINGYRAYVYQPVGQDKNVDLIITYTKDGISVEKRITLTIKAVSKEEIQKEIKLMEEVKKHYFDGINNGANVDKDNVIKNLSAFKEASLNEDGTINWAYTVATEKGYGIAPTDIDPSDNMGVNGYRLFYTSNNAVVTYENLLVNRPEKDTKVTIKSVLSSKKFAKYAEMYPEDEDLQKLYRQVVEVEITVKGTKATVAFDDGIEATENIEKNVTKGEVLDFMPQAPVKEGYTFVGWFKDVDDITTEYKNGQAYEDDVTYTAKYAHVSMLGAQAKEVVNNKSGIRFGTKLYDDGDTIVEKGTIIIPENLIEGGSLTLDTPKAAVSVGNAIYETNKEENYVVYLGTLVNIPSAQFDRAITASSYVKYVDKTGHEYIVYAPYQGGSVTINNLLGK